MRHAQLSGNGTGASGEMKCRTLAGKAANLEFFPGNSVLNAGAERFGSGLFGCEASGKALGCRGFGATIGDFIVGIDAPQKALAKAFDGAGNARNVHEINAGSNQHEATVAQGKKHERPERRPGLMPMQDFSDAGSVHETAETSRALKVWDLSLMALCSDDAPRTVRFLTGAVMACGGCVLSRRFDAGDSAAIEFEFVRATCVEIYSVLIAAGLELSAQSHRMMAALCQCTRETLETTAGDPVRVELTIRRMDGKARMEPGNSRIPPKLA